MLYEYVVWFRDNSLRTDDQNYEWVACFLIRADAETKAKSWGDKLSFSYVERHPGNQFLNSAVEPGENKQLPLVDFGEVVSDTHIGW